MTPSAHPLDLVSGFTKRMLAAALILGTPISAAAQTTSTVTSTTVFQGSYSGGKREDPESVYHSQYLEPHTIGGRLANPSQREQYRAAVAAMAQVKAPALSDAKGKVWYSAGPTNINGRVTTVSIDPYNHNRIFVATVGGIWRSVDGGRRWQRVGLVEPGLKTATVIGGSVGTVAVSPDGHEVVAGTGDPPYNQNNSDVGIWRSEHGGDPHTWTNDADSRDLANGVIFRLLYDPVAPYDIYAATSAGVFIGTHHAESADHTTIQWTRLGGFDGYTSDIAVDFSKTPRVVYAGDIGLSASNYSAGVWKFSPSQPGSTNRAWRRCDSGIDSSNLGGKSRISLAIAQSSPSTLYARVADQNARLQDIYRTTTAGDAPSEGAPAWQSVGPGWHTVDDSTASTFFYSDYNAAISVSPTNPAIVYTGGVDLYQSIDSGQTWTDISRSANTAFFTLHADQHSVVFDPMNSNIVFVGNDGGIARSSDISQPGWHWDNISHGLVITQFYHNAMQQATATLLAGGSQDNGTELTFGNRVWYNPGGCDGYDVDLDSADAETLFSNCNGYLSEFSNPVPGTIGYTQTVAWNLPGNVTALKPPIATDSLTAHASLSAADVAGAGPALVTTNDNISWQTTHVFIGSIQRISSAPSSHFKTFYVATGTDTASTIFSNATGAWLPGDAAAPAPSLGLATAIAVDPSDANVAFMTVNGGKGHVYMTNDGAQTWTLLDGSGNNRLPNDAYFGVAIDPYDANRIYVADEHGVFVGELSATTPRIVQWASFSEGLPEGIDITGMQINRAAGLLSLTTFGYGAYLRDIDPTHGAVPAMVMIRDNVFDRGSEPSPIDMPDPEHPILDRDRVGQFYKPNDQKDQTVNWWTSPDIRIDVPSAHSASEVANRFDNVDGVEMETCPTRVTICPPGTMIDSAPQAGVLANLYTLVTNNGSQEATNVRVIAMYAETPVGSAFPDLPATFWAKTFPAAGACGDIDGASWHVIGCKTIPSVSPDDPEAVQFPWQVPFSMTAAAAIVVIAESSEDPISTGTRSKFSLATIVPNDHHVALRDEEIHDSPRVVEPITELLAAVPQLKLAVTGGAGAQVRAFSSTFHGLTYSGFSRGGASVPSTLTRIGPFQRAFTSPSLQSEAAVSDSSRLHAAAINANENLSLTGSRGVVQTVGHSQLPLLLQIAPANPNQTTAVTTSVVVRDAKGNIVGATTIVLRSRPAP
jgi:hypothetical protein